MRQKSADHETDGGWVKNTLVEAAERKILCPGIIRFRDGSYYLCIGRGVVQRTALI